MTEQIVLNPVFHSWICAAIIIIVAILFLWKEYPFRKRTLLMMPAIILVIGAMTGLLLRPSRVVDATAPPTIVLTKNYDRAKADSLLDRYRNASVVLSRGAEVYSGSTKTNSYQELILNAPSADFILGDGLPEHVLQQLSKTSLHYIPGRRSPGITRLNLPDKIFPNRIYEISGQYFGSHGVALVLAGPEGKTDSVYLDNGNHAFSLRFRPVAPGAITYTVTEHIDGEVRQHTLPVVVQNPRSLRILLIEEHPTFESLYLKNSLARTHQVTIRHQLSRGIFRYEHINTDGGRFDRLSNQTLNGIDVLIIDDQTLARLPESGRREVDKAIKNGLGCLVLYRSRDAFQKIRSFLPLNFVKAKSDTIRLALDGENMVSIPIGSLHPEPDQKLIPLLPHKNTPAGYVEDHFGKLGYSLLTETYPMLLRGDSISYGRIWTSLIEGVARARKAGTEIVFKGTQPYRVDQPLLLEIRSRKKPEVFYNHALLPMRENELIDEVWSTTLWPDTTGWQEVVLVNDSTQDPFYVHPEDELSGVEAAANAYATMRRHKPGYHASKVSSRKEFDPFWFYVMFLSGAAWLWVWPKIKADE